MTYLLGTLLVRPVLTLGLCAFFSGLALLYLVIHRNRRQRIEHARNAEG